MGSFNVSCGVSNLTIDYGDKAGFILLTPETFNYYGGNHLVPHPPQYHHNKNRSLGIYTSDMYLPFAPPVYGTYNDYGRLTDITPSPATAYLEALFKLPVEDIVNFSGNEGHALYESVGPLFQALMPETLQEAFINHDESDVETLISFLCNQLGFTKEVWENLHGEDTVQLHWKDDFDTKIVFEHSDINRVEISTQVRVRTYTRKPEEKTLSGILETYSKASGNYPGFDNAPAKRTYGDTVMTRGQSAALLLELGGMFFLEDVHTRLKSESSEWLKGTLAWDKPATEEQWDDYITLLLKAKELTVATSTDNEEKREEVISQRLLAGMALEQHRINNMMQNVLSVTSLKHNNVQNFPGFLDSMNDTWFLEKELAFTGRYWQPTRVRGSFDSLHMQTLLANIVVEKLRKEAEEWD